MKVDSLGNYDIASSYVLDKDKSVDSFIRYMLARTQAMFVYDGLPETIPARNLEHLLQVKGSCFVTEVEGKLYALSGAAGGEPDPYGEPTQYTVSNVALGLSKTYDIQKDGVFVRNDALELGLLPIFQKYAGLLAENVITMRTVNMMLRMICLISAPDDNTQASAQKFIKDIESGKISAVGENQFFEGVRVHNVSNTQNYLLQFINYEQYLRASCFNEIGLDSNYNMKKANLTEKEVSMNDDFLLPLVDNMIKERQEAIDRINDMFGTSISIDYSSAWKVTHSENEKEIAIAAAIEENPAEVSQNEEKQTTVEVLDNENQTQQGNGSAADTGSHAETENHVRAAADDPVEQAEPDRETSTRDEDTSPTGEKTESITEDKDGEDDDRKEG